MLLDVLPLPCQNSYAGSELVCPVLARPLPVLAGQAVDDAGVPDAGGDIDHVTGVVQREIVVPTALAVVCGFRASAGRAPTA
jgi:hypothetical protein